MSYLTHILELPRVREVWDHLPKIIDHTLLDPSAPVERVVKECEKVREYGFRAFCTTPYHLRKVREYLRNTGVRLCTVVGFPHGYQPTEVKVREAQLYLEWGADDIDMVVNVQALKSGEWEYVEQEIRAVAEVVRERGGVLKVIIETGYLTDEEKRRVTEIIARAGAHFVKTCTGFGPGRANLHDVSLLASVAHSLGLKVKASGGIRHLEDVLALVAAGADVIGTSAGITIAEEWRSARRSTP